MQGLLLKCCFLYSLLGFLVSCSIPSDGSNSPVPMQTPTSGNLTEYQNQKESRGKDTVGLPNKYFGSWGGTGGGLIELTQKEVRDVLERKSYTYDLLLDVKAPTAENQFMIKLRKPPTNSFFKAIIVITFKSDGHFTYYGYDSLEDVKENRFSGAGEFFKNNVESNSNKSR